MCRVASFLFSNGLYSCFRRADKVSLGMASYSVPVTHGEQWRAPESFKPNLQVYKVDWEYFGQVQGRHNHGLWRCIRCLEVVKTIQHYLAQWGVVYIAWTQGHCRNSRGHGPSRIQTINCHEPVILTAARLSGNYHGPMEKVDTPFMFTRDTLT